MPHVLLIGLDPEAFDPSQPGMGAACDPEAVRKGVRRALREMQERGWTALHCAIRPDETAGARVEHVLAQAAYDCVVIAAPLRLSPLYGWVFEAVVNAVHRSAPKAAIAFNVRPDDGADVAARWVAA